MPVLTRHYAKACDAADFDDPRLLAVLGDMLPERDPRACVERKVWEFGRLAMFLEDSGLLDDRARVLAVGAGDERILFWLANRVGEVVATDIYGAGDFASREAGASMLADPAAHAPFPYREDRLDVRWMDARRLEFPDHDFKAQEGDPVSRRARPRRESRSAGGHRAPGRRSTSAAASPR